MKLLSVVVVLAVVSAALARQALPDPLAPPPAHYGHLAGAPSPRPTSAVYNADEQKLQQCQLLLNE